MKLKIAAMRLGGIGDALELSALAVAVKRKYPDSEFTAYVRTETAVKLLEDHPAVDRAIPTKMNIWLIALIQVCSSKEYDIVYDNRYVTRVFYKDVEKFAEDKKITDAAFEKWKKYYNTFPMQNNALGKVWPGTGRALSLETTGLSGDDSDMKINISPSDFVDLNVPGLKYVTVHNGDDVARGSKCWTAERWAKTVDLLQCRGYRVIQLGRAGDEPIHGAHNMSGLFNIKQSADVINNAEFHIDTEGGLVHIARAVNTKCIVLFGPTPERFFSYKGNINVVTPCECRGCWWTHGFWFKKCPKTEETPSKCMFDITEHMVMRAVEKMEGGRK